MVVAWEPRARDLYHMTIHFHPELSISRVRKLDIMPSRQYKFLLLSE